MTIRQISFNPADHTYRDEDNNLYISVTQKIQTVVPKFDVEYWAKYKAKQRGITAEEVKAEWSAITANANYKGNVVHEMAEDSVNQSRINSYVPTGFNLAPRRDYNPVWGYLVDAEVLFKSEFADHYPTVVGAMRDHISTGWLLYAEKRIYSYKHLIAGTIDLLLVKDKEFIIIDWKTNKDELKFTSGYYKKVDGVKTNIWVPKRETLLAPLDNLPNCKGMIYTIQLSTYAYLCELWGFTCRGLILFHLKSWLEDGVVVTSDEGVKGYKIDYKKNAAKVLCEYDINEINLPKSKKKTVNLDML